MLVLVAKHRCSCFDILRPCVEMRILFCAVCLVFPPVQKYHTMLRQQRYFSLAVEKFN